MAGRVVEDGRGTERFDRSGGVRGAGWVGDRVEEAGKGRTVQLGVVMVEREC
jgi:hypothetical protein